MSIHLQPFVTLKMCVAAGNHKKITKNPCIGDSRSFKVIDVDINKKLVTTACYDKQHVCAYLVGDRLTVCEQKLL